MPPLAFISYGAADRPTARAVAAGLKRRGIDYFLDEEHGLPGFSIIGMLDAQLQRASHFLFIASRNSLTAGWPQSEYRAAHEMAIHGQMVFIPCLLGLQRQDLPPLLRDWVSVDLTDMDAALDRIAAAAPASVSICVDLVAVQNAFGAASRLLLGWPQETARQWLERPELGRLHDLVVQDDPKMVILLGSPGVGKSALLARLSNQLTAEGVVLLALKADQLPRDTETPEALDRWVGVPVVETLRGLAAARRVVLLIDQLDALSELMDQHSQRLSALLRLVQAVDGLPNLRIILSSREFEYRNDLRLSTLKAEALTLPPPPWDDIERLLVSRGVDPGGWSGEVREVLRLPQHLSLFMAHLADQGAPGFTSYHGMLEDVLRRLGRDYGPRTVATAEHIAAVMGEEEELSLGAARFQATHAAELQSLEAAGVIVFPESRSKLSFCHQTLADYLRARAFVLAGRSLADFVRAKQESLFVRPTVWTALGYLRSNSPKAYREQFGALWDQPGLRPHLRFLLTAFLGHLGDPDEQEADWLLPLLGGSDRTLRRKALLAMAGSPGWFERSRLRLSARMMGPPEQAWETVALLSKATGFAGEAVLDLIERHWSPRSETRLHALRVLQEFGPWSGRTIALAGRLAADLDSGDVHFVILRVIDSISQDQPDLAPQVLGRYLDGRLTVAEEKLSRLLGDDANWHGLDTIVSRAPKAFLGHTWGWLVKVLEFFASDTDPIVNRYRIDHSMAFPAGRHHRHGLPEAFVVAINAFAEQDFDGFLAFVTANSGSDLMAVHHLLSLGLERIAAARPGAVLDYLIADPRRLAVGESGYAQDSQRLVTAVVPALEPADALRLEAAITAWPRYREPPADEPRETRWHRRMSTRRDRLRLLRVFPIDRLSAKGRRHLEEEERALPNTENAPLEIVEGGWIESPVSAEQMAKASDDDIVGLFVGLVDARERSPSAKRGRFTGGRVEASREFALFASLYPDRALRITERFEPGFQERPAGYALAELGKVTAVTPNDLIQAVRALTDRGFDSCEFRSEAARCLREVARRAKGLDPATCALLESWLTDWAPPPSKPDRARIPENGKAGKDRTDSLLWGRDIVPLPHGNFPILDALMLGLLLRDPPDPDGWLAILEHHLERTEDPEVWTALAMHLDELGHADRERAMAFFVRLFALYPTILQTITGVHLVASIQDWLPTELRESVLANWLHGSWPRGPQAAGEVATLRLCRQPDDREARQHVEDLINGTSLPAGQVAGVRLGVTHVLVHAWREPDLRPLATTLLLRLLPLVEGAAANAWLTALSRPNTLPAEPATRQLLEGLLQHPQLLTGHPTGLLVENLQSLLREMWEPDLICQVASAMVAQAGGSLGDVRTAWAASAGELVEIALTLHRLPRTRSRGLDLFERLLAVDAFEIDQRLGTLDRRPFA